MVHTLKPSWRRLGLAVVAGMMVGGAFGVAPARAQSAIDSPIVILPIAPVELTIPDFVAPVVVGNAGGGRAGLTWATSGRADVDLDIERPRGRNGR